MTQATETGDEAPEQGPATADGAEQGTDGSVAVAVEDASTRLGWIMDQPLAQTGVGLLLLGLTAVLSYILVSRYLLRLVSLGMGRLPGWWVRVIAERRVLYRLVPVVPTVIIARGIVLVPHVAGGVVDAVQRVGQATVVLLTVLAFGALLSAVHDIYTRYPISNNRPIKGYIQVVKLIAYLAAGVMVVASLMAESPWIFLSGLGAMTAIVILIFRDTILSFVAGIQLVNNDLVRVGDWIEMPQFHADGDVLDISLNVVRVRNWDKTITVIPTHKFLEHSFKNWRGMVEAGGRRIKRSVHVDITTIRFLTPEEIKTFGRFRLLRDYMAAKIDELDEYNRSHHTDEDAQLIANARHLTNVGTFRAYVAEYLRRHPLVHQGMTMLVRQLDPGPHGLPIEIFVYISDTRWPIYENAQSDIFDHIFAIAGEFGLRVFQEPSGHDIAQLRARRRQAGAASPV